MLHVFSGSSSIPLLCSKKSSRCPTCSTCIAWEQFVFVQSCFTLSADASFCIDSNRLTDILHFLLLLGPELGTAPRLLHKEYGPRKGVRRMMLCWGSPVCTQLPCISGCGAQAITHPRSTINQLPCCLIGKCILPFFPHCAIFNQCLQILGCTVTTSRSQTSWRHEVRKHVPA